MVWLFAEKLLMLPPAINPLPASVGDEIVMGFPYSENAEAPLLKERLLKGMPAAKLFVVAVCVPPLKMIKSSVVGAMPFQLPGVVQLPSGVAPPFQVRVPAKVGSRLKTLRTVIAAKRIAVRRDGRVGFFIFLTG